MTGGADRVLFFGARGVDVAVLQTQLALLGIDVPGSEFDVAEYGPGTAEAVARVLEPLGRAGSDGLVIDTDADRLIAAAVERTELAAVIGVVTNPVGEPVEGIPARLVGRLVGGGQSQLTAARTSASGRFLLRYPRQGRVGARPIALSVVVAGPEDEPLAAAVPCPAPRVAIVDVALTSWSASGPTIEFDDLLARIEPDLAGADPGLLGEDDVRAVACAWTLPQDRVRALADAGRLRSATGTPLYVGYGLSRAGESLDPANLLRRGREPLADALAEMVRRRVVGDHGSIEHDVRVLFDRLPAVVLQPGDGNARAIGLGAVLDESGVDSGLHGALVDAFYRAGSPSEFWRGLTESGLLDEERARGLQHTMQLAALSTNHSGVVSALRERGSLADLAALSLEEWQEIVRRGSGGVLPPGLAGDTDDERIESYVAGMRLAVRTAFPGAASAAEVATGVEFNAELVGSVLARNPDYHPTESPLSSVNLDGLTDPDRQRAAHALAALRDELIAYPGLRFDPADPGAVLANPIRAGVATFLRNQPAFDLGRESVAQHLADNPDALHDITEDIRPAVTDQLLRLERVGRFTEDINAAHALLAGGLHSALHIARLSPEQFTEQFGYAYADPSQAVVAHRAARSLSTGIAGLYATVQQTVRGISPAAIGEIPAHVQAELARMVPNWQTLFTESSFCQCRDCRSVLSPAAYLVDLLHFLTPAAAPADGAKPVDELLRRRPDLKYLKLSCENTNTAMPYVDIVNEILETFIALGPGANPDVLGKAAAKDTPSGAAAADLAVTPSYLDEAAYTKLLTAYHPFSLPYNRAVDTVRAFLPLLGTSRLELMRAFGTAALPGTEARTAEALGLAPEPAAVIAGTSPATVEQCYGVPAGALPAAVTNVNDLLRVAGLDYPELIELMQTRHINPERAVTLDVLPGVDPCELSNVSLRNLDVPTLDRLHRFVKLARARAVTYRQLDAELTVLSVAAIDQAALHRLAEIDALRADLDVDAETMLALLGPIPTEPTVPDGRSMYARLFLSPSVANPADPAFTLNAAGTELSGAGAPIAGHLAPVLAALRIDARDYAVLAAALLADGALPDETLTLANVSTLYRHRILAKALGLRITELVSLCTLTGIIPFATRATTAAFVGAAKAVAASPFAVKELDRLLRAVTDQATGRVTVLATFRKLREGLQPIVEQTSAGPATVDTVKRALGLILDARVAARIVGVIDGTSDFAAVISGTPMNVTIPPALAGQVGLDPATNTLHVAGALNSKDTSDLLALSNDLDWAAAVTKVHDLPRDLLAANLGDALTSADIAALLDGKPIPPAAAPPTPAESFGYLLDRVLPYARRTLSRALAIQVAAEANGTTADVTAVLLDPVLRAPGDPARPLVDDLLAVGGTGLAADYFPNTTFTGPAVSTVDRAVDFDWGTEPPVTGIPAGPFSVRWTGKILGRGPAATRFSVTATDGVRLTVGGTVVIDDLADKGLAERTGSIVMAPDEVQDVVLEHYHKSGPATIRLAWATATTPEDTVPVANLFRTDPVADLTAASTRLARAASVVNGFALTAPEITHLSAHSARFAGFDLGGYPLDRAAPAAVDAACPALFAAWRRIADYAALRARVGGNGTALIGVFEAAGDVPAQARLAALTGWAPDTLAALATHFGLAAADYTDERALTRLATAMTVAQRTGVPAGTLAGWAVTTPDPAQAAEVIKSAKARFDDDTWAQVAKPVNDALRDSRRAALVAYLLPVLGFDTADRLFEYFLIDVEMTSAMQTSRIKQAISTVQVFVERCLLGQEPAVSRRSIDARQWREWRCLYRVWEANRKVFLFPENWIHPELRDNKTPLFTDLEQQLRRDELTSDNAERHFRSYLDGLREISHLDILAICPQRETDADLLHVFARTVAEPYAYHHRTLDESTATWSPWQPIPVDISGDRIIAVVWNRQLRLIWPVHTERKDETHARLAWTDYRHGGWSRKRISPDDQALTLYAGELTGLTWEAQARFDDLVVTAYRFDGEESERVGGIGPISYASVVRFQPVGTFTFHGCGGAVTSKRLNARTMSYSDGDYALTELGSGAGMTVLPLGGISAGGDSSIKVLGRALDSADLVTRHPWARTLFAPGEVAMYTDAKHTYFLRTAWGSSLGSRLRLADEVALSTVFVPALSALTAATVQLVPLAGGTVPVPGPAAGPATAKAGMVTLAGQADRLTIVDDHIKALLPHDHGGVVDMSFATHYHPYVCAFYSALNAGGVAGLLRLAIQQRTDAPPGTDLGTTFQSTYAPTPRVDHPYPHENVDFSTSGAYSDYNWELFFHAPLMMAILLSAEQRFDEAEVWFRYILDVTTPSKDPAPGRYWNVKPFHDAGPADTLITMLSALRYTGTDPARQAAQASVRAQLTAMAQDPFNPHHIARLRPAAYQKTVVMRYIEHTLARGDLHFRRNEIDVAVLYYLRASAVLGSRPQIVPEQETPAKTYAELLSSGLDDFSNALVAWENAFPFTVDGTVAAGPGAVAPLGTTFYFCVPPNGKLLGNWDQVADRLFKIRHGLDIDGIARQVPLFEPPIDPGLLVRARAAGVDLNSVLADLGAPASPYRFTVVLERARRLCQELNGLGSAMLAALEKRDAEELAELRSTHEIALLDLTKRIKQDQVKEAAHQRAALDDTLAMVISRRDFYDAAIKIGLIKGEKDQLTGLDSAESYQQSAAENDITAQRSNMLPNFSFNFGTLPSSGISFGGQQIAAVFAAIAHGYQSMSASDTHRANRASIVAGQVRRNNDWQRELDVANHEITQIGKQIAAADVRVAIAGYEADNHETQTENAREELDFLRTKYTNEDLYGWLVDQLSTVYFQTYRLAYDLAKQAERAYRYELAVADSDFIQFGYWDNLKHGLLSGDRLLLALGQLEDAYHRRNRRELEITKSVSLLLTDPAALINLKATGTCEFSLPEALFDADFPGHYLRRIKSVSVTIPCVAGPHTSVNATLRLLKHKTRTSPSAAGGYVERDSDTRFTYQFGALDAIATSTGQRDAGMFELTFRDERYLPFEGAGAVSTWRLEMPKDCNAFDFETVTDVVMSLSYTARDGGAPLRDAARKANTPKQEGRQRLFSLRHEFPDQWHRFLHPEPTADRQDMALTITSDRFPFPFRNRKIEVTGAHLYVKLADGTVYPGAGTPLMLNVTPPDAAAPTHETFTATGAMPDLLIAALPNLSVDPKKPGDWRISAAEVDISGLDAALRSDMSAGATIHWRLNPAVVHDIMILLDYTA